MRHIPDLLRMMERRSFWFVVGLLITALQLRLTAAALGMTKEQLATLIEEDWTSIEFVSWLNGCAALFALGGIVAAVALHIAGVF